jgi:membrane protease YdiL (CAAX protease family)
MNKRFSGPVGQAVLFFAITFSWTWLFWMAAALIGQPIDSAVTIFLIGVGGVGPAGSAIVLTLRDGDKVRRRDFWQRLVDVRRVRLKWAAIIFLTVPLTSLLAVWTRTVFTGQAYAFEQARTLLSNPIGLPVLVLTTFFFGPLPEEPGWRGYALDRLQSRWNAVIASLVLATVWALWHLPLFFIPGSYQQEIGFGTAGFWLYMGGVFPETILMTWIYNNTQASTLSAIMFHFMINFSGNFIDITQGLAPYRLGWSTLIAVLVILSFGKNLVKQRESRVRQPQ